MTARVRAPELRGRGWLNTGGRDLTLADLRGKIVLLDFWTFCCINCLHVLDELRPLEEKYGDALVVIGVHSPKFEHERDPAALQAAVERYGVHHPVVDDGDMHLWQQYAAKAWPTLAVIDPTGYLVASMAGEGHAEGLSRLIDELIAKHEADGTLHRGDGPYVPPTPGDTLLRFPGKAIELPNGNLLVSDSARHSLAEITPDAETLVRRIGTGERGQPFNEPQGLLLLPPAVAAVAGYDVLVADTVAHQLRGLVLKTGEVTLVAGSGRPWRSTVDDHSHDALAADLSSPWDLAWFDDKVIVAMAGIHQLWWFDPIKRTVGVYAGTTVESLRDGPIPDVWMAQPSGLSAGGDRLWIADSETSALRWISDGVLHTAVGQGLFDFGHVDGPAAEALLQHPLGVAALPDGSVLIADTYNGAVRRYDPSSATVSTVDSGLAEPSDVLITKDGDVIVVESAAHRLTRLAPGVVKTVTGERQKTERPASPLAAGPVTLDVVFTPAPGQKLDTQFGPSTRLTVSASPEELLLEGAGSTTDLSRRLVINPDVSQGVLQVVAQAATCDVDVENAACHLTRQDWGVPIVVTADGPSRLPLILRGMDENGTGENRMGQNGTGDSGTGEN
jgi:thiol-disulfide isomerase/thioredoxin